MSFEEPSLQIEASMPDGTGQCDVALDDLRSHDSDVSRQAWNAAYPRLWSAGMRLAGRLLSGGQWESHREDAVATAIGQVVAGLIARSSASYNQMFTFDDVVGMTLTIVRRRITDIHRQRSRCREDAVEELPEHAAMSEEARFSPSELRIQIAALDPPKPALFMDRFFGGLTTREVAEKQGMPHGTVLTHFAQGLRLLRERLLQLEI
jgi:RNA polymerase sigma factor (sigma-70 family)